MSLLLDSAVKAAILTTTITRGNTDKLTYVITGPGGPSAQTVPTVTNDTAKRDKTSVATSSASSDNKVLLHNKSDISSLMVKAVKGEYTSLVTEWPNLVMDANIFFWLCEIFVCFWLSAYSNVFKISQTEWQLASKI